MKTHPAGSTRKGQGSKATVVIAISREGLAWAGGFFDGEGHVRSFGDRSYPALQVAQAGSFTAPPEVLTRFQKAVCGLGYVYGPMFAPERLEHMPQWSYEAHGFEAVQAIFAIPALVRSSERSSHGSTLLMPLSRSHGVARAYALAAHCARPVRMVMTTATRMSTEPAGGHVAAVAISDRPPSIERRRRS